MNPRATPLSPSAAAVPGRHLVPPRLCCSLLTCLPASGPQSLPCVLSSQILFAMSQVLSHQSRCFQNGPGGPTRSTLPPRPRLGPSRPAAPASGPWRSLAVPLCPPCLPSDTLCRPHLFFPHPSPGRGAACFVYGWSQCQSTAGPSKCPPGRRRAGGRCGVVSWQASAGSREGSVGDDGAFWGTRCGIPGQGPPEFSRLVLWLQTLRCSGHRKDIQALPLTAGSVPSCTVSP